MKDHISVCICTFRRNQMLERLLRSLADQDTNPLFDISVVVVDNDASGPACELVKRLSLELTMEIEYSIEPDQSIPAARNRALRIARGNYIAIIDDDEFPADDWLNKLYRAIQDYKADGALGPVIPFFDQPPPKWLLKGRLCERPVYKTGTLLKWDQTRTGNVLLKKEVFDRDQLQFDLNMKTSSSDRAFFKLAIQHGFTFIAVKDAPVYEIVPKDRWTKRYYLRRALVHGYNAHKNSSGDLRGFRAVLIPLKSIGAVLGYAMMLPASIIMGSHVIVKCLEGGGYHLSRLCALLGIELVKKRDF